jgi:hypothetical protein
MHENVMNTAYSMKPIHRLPLVLAFLLLFLIAAAFVSFALGAYFVFNEPVSNVVAVTSHSNGVYTLQVKANSLEANQSRTIWIDPKIISDSAGDPIGVVNGTGYRVGNAITDSAGNLRANFVLSNMAELTAVLNDDQRPHSVWVVGLENLTALQGSSQLVYHISVDSEQNYSARSVGNGVILFVLLFSFPVFFHFTFGELFIALWTIYLIMFAMALNGPFRSVLGAIKDSMQTGVRAIFDNALFATMAIFSLVLWGEFVAIIIQQAGGISTGSLPPQDGLVTFLGLTIAPLREEVGFRVIPIGLASLLILASRHKVRDGLLSLWHPSRYLKKDDSPHQYNRDIKIIYVMIGISAATFGAAHFLSGAGWGPGKILDAAIGGIGFAALYYKYGLPSAVLGHWAVDYFLVTYTLVQSLLNFYLLLYFWSLAVAIASGIALLYLLLRRNQRPITRIPQ